MGAVMGKASEQLATLRFVERRPLDVMEHAVEQLIRQLQALAGIQAFEFAQ